MLQEGGLVEAPSLAVRTAVALRRIVTDVLATKVQFHICRNEDAYHRMVKRMRGCGEVIVIALLANIKVLAAQAAIAPEGEGPLSASFALDTLVAIHRHCSASAW